MSAARYALIAALGTAFLFCAGLLGLGVLFVGRHAAAPPNAKCPVCGERFHADFHPRMRHMFTLTCPYCGVELQETVFGGPKAKPPAGWARPGEVKWVVPPDGGAEGP